MHWALPRRARVLDLAAGAGKLTAGLLRVPDNVIAIEPDPAMLAELRRRFASVPTIRASAERLPLAEDSLDAVCVGQAFHWFDTDQARAERFPEHPDFGTAERRVFDHVQRRTAQSMVATVATHSNVLVISAEERARVLGGLAVFLADCPATSRGEFDLPLRTTAVRLIRH